MSWVTVTDMEDRENVVNTDHIVLFRANSKPDVDGEYTTVLFRSGNLIHLRMTVDEFRKKLVRTGPPTAAERRATAGRNAKEQLRRRAEAQGDL